MALAETKTRQVPGFETDLPGPPQQHLLRPRATAVDMAPWREREKRGCHGLVPVPSHETSSPSTLLWAACVVETGSEMNGLPRSEV
jgi:hypothetical protein